ncbi:Ku protein [Streptomyces sp.]|uniref:non-homologous end joining protein Ku n=1 Tax=Streptomyces sp. TaxID=1931 RepID=UPI002F41336C
MPPVWSGAVTFGLVTIPVQLQTAARSQKIPFRQIHLADHGRVRYQKTCELDGQRLEPGDIGRAYETPDHQLVPLTDDELDQMPLPTAKTIEVQGFLDTSTVDSMQLDTPYFLAPASPAANKPYVLMREALDRSGKAAVGKVALRGSGEALAMIRPDGDVLVLHRLRWPDEIRTPDDAAPRAEVDISDEEMAGALALIEAIGDVDMSRERDEYAAAMESLIDAKAQGTQPPLTAAEPEQAEADTTDLMTTLQAATEQARADRGDTGRRPAGRRRSR